MALAGAVAALVPASCVGSVTAGTLDEEVRSRGGGLGQDLVLEAVDAVEAELGVEAVELRLVTLAPSQVHMEVRVPGTERDVDSWSYGTSGLYGGRGLRGPDPVAVSASGPPIETLLFRVADARLDRLDATVDEAIAQAGLAGGYAQSATVSRAGGGPGPVTTVTVTDDRSTVVVTFAPDGTVAEVRQT